MKKIFFVISSALLICLAALTHAQTHSDQATVKLKQLEKTFDGKIGVYAIDTNSNTTIGYREKEYFPVQSTFKVIGAGALLKQAASNKSLLAEKIHYTKKDLLFWHPITGKYVKEGMTLDELAEATISYSDNPAINLIMKKLGGPQSISAFAHSIGNKSFNIEHYEGDLNSDLNVKMDSATPEDMALSLKKLTLGNILSPSQREKLMTWMRNDTVGYKRMRAGVPGGWIVADKTGSGDYGIANDIGVVWSPLCKPIILAIYTAQNKKDAQRREDIVASTTSILLDEFAKSDSCFNELNS
jgi:beta-lactamase class A